jgi:hypothetical protein
MEQNEKNAFFFVVVSFVSKNKKKIIFVLMLFDLIALIVDKIKMVFCVIDLIACPTFAFLCFSLSRSIPNIKIST